MVDEMNIWKHLNLGKKTFIFYLIFVCFVSYLISSSVMVFAASDSVSLDFSKSEITINTTKTEYVEITVVNNQTIEDTFSLSVWPHETWEGITPNLERYTARLEPDTQKTVKLYLTVSSDADEIITTFLVTAKSNTNSNVTASDELRVRVLRETSVYISDISLDKYLLDQGECVNITSSITNLDASDGPFKLNTRIRKGTDVIESFDNEVPYVKGKSIEKVINQYCFDKYAESGRYTILSELRTELNKKLDSRTETLKITDISDIELEKDVQYTPFAQIKTITVKNEGNTIETDFYVTETVSSFVNKIFYPIDQPTSTEEQDNKYTYSWEIESLSPGESMQIQYEIRYVSIWFTGLVIILLVILAFSYVYTPRITKKYNLVGSLKKGKEIPIMLEIKNSTIHEIKNVVVEDSVTPIATLVSKFDTMKPKSKKTDTGTQLTWKIKSLKPLEERVLTYRIKPNVDIIGSMRLPKATMEYLNNKKEKKVVASKSVEIK